MGPDCDTGLLPRSISELIGCEPGEVMSRRKQKMEQPMALVVFVDQGEKAEESGFVEVC